MMADQRGKFNMFKELKASTKAGQRVMSMADRNVGFDIWDVYVAPSFSKRRAWDWCYDEYLATQDRNSFHICSFNTFGFTVAWKGTKDGENILRVETKDSHYIVWLDR